MLRVFIGLLLPLHGLLHLIGAVYGFRLFYTSAYTGQTTFPLPLSLVRTTNVLWLLACALFLAAAVLFLLRRDWWWMMGAAAVVLSQTLIGLSWPDAKWGTLANVLIALLLVVAFSNWRFNKSATRDVQALMTHLPSSRPVVTINDMVHLPAPAQQWLFRSGVVGKEAAPAVQLQQKGAMRTTPNGKWMPVSAVQYIRTDRPGFVWIAMVKAAPGIFMSGRDRYYNGQAHMLIKLLSLYPVANNKGPLVDQGTLLRYLAEIVWCPSVGLEEYIRWQAIDHRHALATMSYGGVTASGVFGFTPEGDVESFEAQRYYSRKEAATLETWHISVEPGTYRSFNGIRIPVRSSVTWKLKEGDFTWYKLEIVESMVYTP